MRQRGRCTWLIGSTGLLAALAWATYRPAEAQVDRTALRPGLVATHRDSGKAEVVQLEPTIALALGPGESAHPRLSPDGGTVRWEGYLNVLRAGDYQFSATLRGTFRLTVAGKEVLRGDAKAQTPTSIEGPATRLEAGALPLVAEFTRAPGAARVQVSWQAPHFYREPLPHTAVRHLPAKAPGRLALDRDSERGRFLAEEMSCTACHRPDEGDRLSKGLLSRQGPDLTKIGTRVHAGWLYCRLIADPSEQPGRVMPRLFSDDAAGRSEAYAVTRFLARGGPPKGGPAPLPKQLKLSIERGRRLFTTTGCIVCHRDPPKDGAGQVENLSYYPLREVSGKTTPQKLAEYLANPLSVDPSGRMPHMLLNAKEAADLANFLCLEKGPQPIPKLPAAPKSEEALTVFRRLGPKPAEVDAFQRLSADRQWEELGQRLVHARNCASCHTLDMGDKPPAGARVSFAALKEPKRQGQGCLATPPNPPRAGGGKGGVGTAPQFPLTEADRNALRVFLKEGSTGAGSPSPPHAARVTLQRFNCLACHARSGEGGLSAELVQELRRYEKAEDAEAIVRPPLTEVGDKLRTSWMRQVLTEGARARPWMGLRMPQFGTAHVGKLPEALASLDGSTPDDAPHKVALTQSMIDSGRHLVGKAAFGCISCHDIAGTPSSGTRGPDLALMSQRLRYGWYRRWLESAQRMQPGTKMPTVFPDGRSLLDNVLGGKADAQAEAMWGYLSLGPTLPLPEGLEPPKGLVVTVKDRPVLLRTFLPDAGSRAVAVGYPAGVSVAFDPVTCRLAYAWSGHFLDAAPVWDNRGGSPAKILGQRFWTAPPGCPVGVSDGPAPPDFAAQARDPAFGGPVPEGKLFTGSRRLFFDGYTLDRAGLPTFRYHLDSGGAKMVKVAERPEPLRGLAGVGVGRGFVIEIPAGKTVWLLAGESGQAPRWLDGKGTVTPVEAKQETVEAPAAGRRVLLGEGKQVTVLVVGEVPEGTLWHLSRQGSGWRVLLRLPRGAEGVAVRLRLEVWSVGRDDPALLRELASGK
ncbi:MAG: hypothetical protein L0Z62_37350 [Gemmataceae bacterium]|nr:hypothetical protein [Gemmataceae bacterium]